MRSMLSSVLTAAVLLSSSAFAKPACLLRKRAATAALPKDFPDPSIIQDVDGQWYAFATTGNKKQVQVARASASSGPWTLLSNDLLPNGGAWTTSKNTWAPDVRITDNGTYVLYYSGQVANSTAHHCVGTATASTILGPYTPAAEPFNCDLTVGGSIDASGFQDADGTRYVTYKIDGNSIGHGGSCGNTVAPIVPTPIMLQEVKADLVTKVGNPIQILDRTTADGPYVEAPAIFRESNGTYVLFFSSGCFTDPTYNVNYATAKSVKGPYTRSTTPLIETDDAFGLTAPGGATPLVDGSAIVFHADCDEGRCLYESKTQLSGLTVVLNGVGGLGM
ncbi:glycosyl hydrolase family 43 protein [Xylariales sp. PMI_506]|nr:glycosyl hydrolase family 43 protein [Xylariales sp. PMI_506]